MAKKARRSVKEKIEIAKKICENYGYGKKTIVQCCNDQGISDSTFQEWARAVPEISEIYSQAKVDFDRIYKSEVTHRCLTSLEKLVSGFTVDEVVQDGTPIYDENGNIVGTKIKNVRKIKKYFAPNITAIMFTLRALEAGTYRDGRPDEKREPQVFQIGDKLITF